jgi:hypothetical protein
LKEKSERIEGVGFGYVEKGRGYGQNNHLLPPSLTIQNAGDREADRGRGEGRRRPGPWGRPGSGAKRRGGREQLIPLLTLVGDRLWREIDGGGRSATRNGTGGAGGGDGELGEEGELVVEVRDEVGSLSGPFIGAGRSVRWRYLSSRSFDGRQWRWGEKYPGTDSPVRLLGTGCCWM